jgi:hypothetical protein
MSYSKYAENINIKMDDDALKQVPKFKNVGSTFREDVENKEDIIQRVKEPKIMFNNKKQLLCSNNLVLEIKYKLTKSCIWSVDLYGSEKWTLGKNKDRVVNAFETWCRRKMLKIKWAERITTDEVFQMAKKERLLLKI